MPVTTYATTAQMEDYTAQLDADLRDLLERVKHETGQTYYARRIEKKRGVWSRPHSLYEVYWPVRPGAEYQIFHFGPNQPEGSSIGTLVARPAVVAWLLGVLAGYAARKDQP